MKTQRLIIGLLAALATNALAQPSVQAPASAAPGRVSALADAQPDKNGVKRMAILRGLDKVTGRARVGADFSLPGQLIGKVLRSPHAHAVIKSIDTSKAEALNGVKAVVTAKDFPDQPNLIVPTGEMQVNMRDITRNIMAREKALYEGHPVAAVAAVSEAIAKQALALIKVEYKVLPHVIDVAEGETGEVLMGFDDLSLVRWYVDGDPDRRVFRDGWVATGDIGRLDADGYLTLIDRVADVINTGGYKVG